MASITRYTTKDGDKRYMFRIYLGIDPKTGRKKQTTRRGFKTQKAAKLEISKLQLQIEQGGIKQQQKRTYQNVYDEFLESYRLTVRQSTLRNFKYKTAKHVLPPLGKMLIDKVTPHDLQKLVNKWAVEMPRFSYVYNMMKRIFTFAYKRDYISKNPADLIIMPKHDDSGPKDNYYTRDELVHFFKAPYFKDHPRQYTLFRLLAFSGIRRSESLALTWSDVDFEHNTIKISKTLSKLLKGGNCIESPKTQTGTRTVILDDTTMRILKEWHSKQSRHFLFKGINTFGVDAFIFSKMNSTDHIGVMAPERWLKSAYETINMRHITVHGFRHTHASMLFVAGVPIKEIQERLGHSDPSITLKIYTHIGQKQHRDAVKKLTEYADF